MNDLQLKREMNIHGIDLLSADTIEEKALQFQRALKIVLVPRDVSDKTSHRNVTNWLIKNCQSGRFDPNIIFRRVLDFALESSGPTSRCPGAVFTYLLKKELGYSKDVTSGKEP